MRTCSDDSTQLYIVKPTNDFFLSQICRMVPKNFDISTIEMNDVSAFQRTFECPSTTSRSKFIPSWNSKIPLLVSFPRRHHMLDEPWKGLSFCGGVPKYYGYTGRFSNFSRLQEKALFLWYIFRFKIRKFETFEHFQWKIDFTVNTLNPRTSELFIIDVCKKARWNTRK